MMPSPMSDGPPPPEARPQEQGLPPVPNSIISGQGEQQGKKQESGLQKQTLEMAMQKLLEYKNSVESLVTVMKAVDPESVALFIPAIEVGKALESRLQQVSQRANANQPSMAGMPGGNGPQMQQPPGGQSAMGA
jgi:hypothetical protein